MRERGSGNIGASNVGRGYGRRHGIPVMLLDVAKGFVPALVGVAVSGEPGMLAGGSCDGGHWRPLFLGFRKGGKTVATAGGVVWAAARSRRRGLPAGRRLALVEPWPVIVFGSLAGGVVVVLHRANIRRLRAGTESRFHVRRTARA